MIYYRDDRFVKKKKKMLKLGIKKEIKLFSCFPIKCKVQKVTFERKEQILFVRRI